jgi:hypothetical protein
MTFCEWVCKSCGRRGDPNDPLVECPFCGEQRIPSGTEDEFMADLFNATAPPGTRCTVRGAESIVASWSWIGPRGEAVVKIGPLNEVVPVGDVKVSVEAMPHRNPIAERQ